MERQGSNARERQLMRTQSNALNATRTPRCDHTWVSVEDLAAELQIPKSTIYGWKSRGVGPQWTRVGKHLRARRSDVDAWLNSLIEAA
jgi:excisionase family DNA binding protein